MKILNNIIGILLFVGVFTLMVWMAMLTREIIER